MAVTSESFARKVALATGIVALAIVVLLLLWNILDALLLVFAAILVACFLRGLAEFLSEKTRLPIDWSLAVVILLVGVSMAVTIWMLAPRVAAQTDSLSQSLTGSARQLTAEISRYEWGKRLLAEAPTLRQLTVRGNIVSRVTGIFRPPSDSSPMWCWWFLSAFTSRPIQRFTWAVRFVFSQRSGVGE